MTVNNSHLDIILKQVGDFGKYQLRITFLILILFIIIYFGGIVWLFETKLVNYRCKIAECESDPEQFKPAWWSDAIPSVDKQPAHCLKYRWISNDSQQQCSASNFDRSVKEACDTYIYETNERSILQDFDLHCERNRWKLTLVGTVNSVGYFVGLPLAGFLSDKYGRKLVLVVVTVLSALSGLIRSFSQSYIFFIVMAFTDAFFGAGLYTIGFTLGVELVGPNKRVLVGSVICAFYSLGGVIACGVAWGLQTWRPLVQIVYSIQLLVLVYYWLMPESVRWLLAKKRYEEVRLILRKIAKTNGKTISEGSINMLCLDVLTTNRNYPVKELFQSFTLTKRFINCCFCWIISIFVYNGLTIYSIAISNNSYLDVMLTILVEIPGCVTVYLILDKIGRRFTLVGSFLLTAVLTTSVIFVPTDLNWLRLCIYLMGKLCASMSATVIYTLTTEIFPTPLRNSLLSICSMFGRIGTILSPQMPLLEAIWTPLPLVLFGATSLIGCVMSLLFPETAHIKLPDTITEAENIGKKVDIANKNVA